MRKLKVEYTAFDYEEINPSDTFFGELSRQLTPKIRYMVKDVILRENLSKLVCISVDPTSYILPQYKDGVNYMRMNISALSASLIICRFVVSWHKDIEGPIYPWDDLQKGEKIHFDFLIDESEIKVLNLMLPKLYHPIVKSEKSGLPFDYQIYYGGETLVLYYYKQISPNDVQEVNRVLTKFSEERNIYPEIMILSYEITKITKTQIEIIIDFNMCCCEAIEALIYSFHNQNNIKRIVYR